MNIPVTNTPDSRRPCLPASRYSQAAGFTVTELAVTVAIAAILAAVAVPSFNGLMATGRARAFASEMFAALSKTRSLALALNKNVTLSANTGGWSSGWQIQDPNNAGTNLDYRGPAVGGGVTVTGPTSVTFSPSGRIPAGSLAPVIVITTANGSTTLYQCVSVDLGGRPYMSAASTC